MGAVIGAVDCGTRESDMAAGTEQDPARADRVRNGPRGRPNRPMWVLPLQDPEEPRQGVVEAIHDALFQRNDRIVRDANLLRTDIGAALRDVAVPDAVLVLEVHHPVLAV